MGNPSQSYGASPAVWHHTLLRRVQSDITELVRTDQWASSNALVSLVQLCRKSFK